LKMAVYVDDMYKSPMGRLGRMKMSHMIADTDKELHDMAALIGLNKKWFQGDHYDVSMLLRDRAVANGAIELTRMQLGRRAIEARRKKNSVMMFIDPDKVEKIPEWAETTAQPE
jgi:hypothetical protein